MDTTIIENVIMQLQGLLSKKESVEKPKKAPKKAQEETSAAGGSEETAEKPKKERKKKEETPAAGGSDEPAEKPKKERKKKEETPAAGGSDEPAEKPKKERKKKEETPAAGGSDEPAKKPSKKKDKNLDNDLSGPVTKKFNEIIGEDKDKSKFVDYVNSMSPDSYASKKLEEHMRDYMNPKSLTYLELRAQKNLLVEVYTGTYRNTADNAIVTGPPELEDEEFEDSEYPVGRKILIGNNTNRVYADNADGPDGPFLGYWGVAEFREPDL